MPIHIIRDVALTIRSFHKRITDFLRYRQATRDMNTRYPDATSEEVKREDCCIICRESMKAWPPQSNPEVTLDNDPTEDTRRPLLNQRARPKKLPCGHVLHFACLRSWLERQQKCPTCRAPVLVHNSAIQAQPQQTPNQGLRALPEPDLPRNPILGPFNGQPAIPAQNVYQFGPLRIAFGARNGVRGPTPQVNHPHPNMAVAGGNAALLNDTMGHFRQPGLAETRLHANSHTSALTAQLQQIEQQLLREMSSLRLQADQLYVVRALQNELSRLRLVQANSHTPPTTSGTQGQIRPTPSLSNTSQYFQNGPMFTSSPTQHNIGSNHVNLPPSLSLPEGWSILPLQRISYAFEPGHMTGQLIHQPLTQGSTSIPSQSQQTGPLNDHTHVAPLAETASENCADQSATVDLSRKSSNNDKSSTESQLPIWGSISPEMAATASATVKPGTEVADTGQASEAQYFGEQRESQSKGKTRASAVEDSLSDVD